MFPSRAVTRAMAKKVDSGQDTMPELTDQKLTKGIDEQISNSQEGMFKNPKTRINRQTQN